MTAGDTLLTISLAGSLFFSISPQAARGKVFLYLVLTVAPFVVVSPLLGPFIDRSRGARRLLVVVSAAIRVVVCLVMAGNLHSLLLFPLAFVMLVCSKIYLVTKGALVPLVAEAAPRPDGNEDHEEMATLNARLGLLASLAGFLSSLPAIAVLKLLGGPWVLRLDALVFVAATVAGLRLPMRRSPRPRPGPEAATPSAPEEEDAWARPGPLAALGARFNTHPEVTLARSAMSFLKALVGFLTFEIAFGLRRMHAETGWFGLVLAASVAGALVGVLLVPRLRRSMSEPALLASALWLAAGAGVMAAFAHLLAAQAFMAFLIGLAAAAGKPAFDALVQRHLPPAEQGRAFARFETWFQLWWVCGALVPVIATLPLMSGDIIIAAVAAAGALSYLTGRRAARLRMTGTGD